MTLILAGIAINAFIGALIGLFTFMSDDAQMRSIAFWTLGSLAQATWAKVAVVTPLALAGLVGAVLIARDLDLLVLGERSARHLGVDVERLRRSALVLIAILTASAVAVSGQILFIGLVVPRLIRMVVGSAHGLLIPAAAGARSIVLALADLLSRPAAAPTEIPLGAITALVVAPFFYWLLRRTRASQGGWA